MWFRKPLLYPAELRDQFNGARAGLEHFPIKWDREMLQISLLSHVLSENRFPPIGSKPEGMLFGIMLQPREEAKTDVQNVASTRR